MLVLVLVLVYVVTAMGELVGCAVLTEAVGVLVLMWEGVGVLEGGEVGMNVGVEVRVDETVDEAVGVGVTVEHDPV